MRTLLLCLALIGLNACEDDAPKPPTPKTTVSVNTDPVATVDGALNSSKMPDWAKIEGVREDTRDGRKVYVAVASATMKNIALARDAAANRARAAILRVAQGAGKGELVQGTLTGSRIVRSYSEGDTMVVEVEADLP
ncbi:MAG: hypothetical protein IT381_05280 [Deltaproteobacteria bacterium]|nr:hypothetical protein [Deltaproteobacteria bacterium]